MTNFFIIQNDNNKNWKFKLKGKCRVSSLPSEEMFLQKLSDATSIPSNFYMEKGVYGSAGAKIENFREIMFNFKHHGKSAEEIMDDLRMSIMDKAGRLIIQFGESVIVEESGIKIDAVLVATIMSVFSAFASNSGFPIIQMFPEKSNTRRYYMKSSPNFIVTFLWEKKLKYSLAECKSFTDKLINYLNEPEAIERKKERLSIEGRIGEYDASLKELEEREPKSKDYVNILKENIIKIDRKVRNDLKLVNFGSETPESRNLRRRLEDLGERIFALYEKLLFGNRLS